MKVGKMALGLLQVIHVKVLIFLVKNDYTFGKLSYLSRLQIGDLSNVGYEFKFR